MGQPQPPSQTPQRRTQNVHEVVLGFGKKQNIDEARRCPQCATPTCLRGCPLGVDIPGFIRFLREDDSTSALERIRRDNPFPAVCGRVCTAPCEPACIFDAEGAPIAIRALERYASDNGKPKPQPIRVLPVDKQRNVGIIGSGPSGLSAAWFLAQAGFTVTIYEAMDQPGGLLRYGVPEFRLPQKVLDEQIADLKAMNVRIQTNVLIGGNMPMRDVLAGNAAVLLALGAAVPDLADIDGHNLGGVYYAEEFLLRANMGGKEKAIEGAAKLMHGTHTVIIGAGIVGMDAARLAVRAGQQVTVMFGGMEEEMGVSLDDGRMTVEEGVVIEIPVEPVSVDGNEYGHAKSVTGRRMELIERDGSIIFEPTAESHVNLEAQTVILSHGRLPNAFLRTHVSQLQWNDDGSLWIDPDTRMTSIEKVFAAGEITTGAGAIVDAMAAGKAAAKHMIEFLE